MQEHGKNRPSPAPCTGSRGQPHVPGTWQPTGTGSRGQPHVPGMWQPMGTGSRGQPHIPGTWQPTGTGSCGQPHVPGTWQLSATRPRHVAAHRPKEPHPLTNGLRAAAAVRAHPVTWAASRGQATMCHYTPGRCQLQALLPSTLKAVGTLMFQQTATDGQSYMETWGVTEAEGGRLTGRVPGPAEPTTQARWRGPCVPSSAPMEGALCPQLTTDGEGSVSAADSRRLTPAPTSLAPSCPVQALPAGCFPPKEATTDPPRNSLLTVALPQLKISLQCFQTYLVKKICLGDE